MATKLFAKALVLILFFLHECFGSVHTFDVHKWCESEQQEEEEGRGYLRDGLHLLLLGVGSSAVQHLEEV